MELKEKAEKIIERFEFEVRDLDNEVSHTKEEAIQCALICVENEYHSLIEMLFNLRSCKVIESDRVYNHRLNELITERDSLKQMLIKE